jgi:hypothetical protein
MWSRPAYRCWYTTAEPVVLVILVTVYRGTDQTDLSVARRFGGTTYSSTVPRSQLISQTLPGAGEAEMLIQGVVRVGRL